MLKTPAPPKFSDGWQLGQPDLVVKMDRAFEVPAEGPDICQNFVIPLNFPDDKWVTAVEFQATAPEVLHHILYFLDESGRAIARRVKEGVWELSFCAACSKVLHGWCPPDTRVHNHDQAEKAWKRMLALFEQALS